MKKVIFDLNPNYEIHSDFRIYSLRRNMFLKNRNTNGYDTVCIKIEGKRSRDVYVDRLVYHAFVEKLDLTKNNYVIYTKPGKEKHYKTLIKETRFKKFKKSTKNNRPKSIIQPNQWKEIYEKSLFKTEREIGMEYGVTGAAINMVKKKYLKSLKVKVEK